MGVAILAIYGLFTLVALLNLLLMRRPKPRSEGDTFCVLIPARNEEKNLRELIPMLTAQESGAPKIYVFDDESSDETGAVASSLGATVIRPREKLPVGWTGKNRACHELGKAAAEDSDARWYLFLDADVRPAPDFLNGLRGLAAEVGGKSGVMTGFPNMLPGRGPEPLFLAWVGWILLATNPFGLVCRTGMGHNRFTNGQIHAWKAEVYTRLWPNEQVKSHIMEDVMMGRLLGKEGIKVEVANLSRFLRVKMYETWRETLDGMSKNSFEITGSYLGSVLLSLLFLLIAVGWALAGPFWLAALITFTLGGLLVSLTVRAPFWPAFLMPIVCLIGGLTVLRSAWWRKSGQTRWKGRVYGG